MNSKDYKTYRNILEIKTLPINEAINIKTLEDVKNNPLFKDFDLRKEDLEIVLKYRFNAFVCRRGLRFYSSACCLKPVKSKFSTNNFKKIRIPQFSETRFSSFVGLFSCFYVYKQ